MPQVNVNGVPIQYPATGDVEWGDEATEFAIQVGAVLQKIGQGNQTPTTNNIVIGSISSPGNLTVASGNLTVTTGNTDLGGTLDVTGATSLDSTLDVTGVTTIVDDLIVDTDTLFVDVSTDRVGINTATPTVALDVVGDIKSSAGITGASATLTDLTVDTNVIKTDSINDRVGINTTSPTVALDVTGKILVSSDITVGGVIVADDSTNVTTAPPITFTGDTDTGIGHSSANTLDFVTGGVPRARISSVGLQSSVIPDLSGSNTNLFPEYKCRAWVNFNGTGTIAIQASGNVSTLTDIDVGRYDVNLAVAMPDDNYAIAGCATRAKNGTGGDANAIFSVDRFSSSSFRAQTYQANSAYIDPPFVMAVLFR